MAALPTDARCPPGMVFVSGGGTVGVDPSRFAVVHTRGRPTVVAPEAECPAALATVDDPVACWVQTDLVDPVLRPRAVTLDGFCVDRHPFPGPGARYTVDGMTAWDAQVLRDLLASTSLGGRRLCTASELQVAVAGPIGNRPILYGPRHRPERCPADAPIGQDPLCTNPETGVFEYAAVHSHWVEADPAFVAAACDRPPCLAAGRRALTPGMLVVLGGTGRRQTRQAPLTPHTWHDHGRPAPTGCDAMGHDDQPAICATPSPAWGRHDAAMVAAEARWREWVAVARETGRMDRFLDHGVGGRSCPGGE